MSCNGCQFGTSEKVNDFGRVEMLTVNDWLSDLPDTTTESDIVEVRFKGTRKEYFKNSYEIKIKRGDRVVCGMAPGHDVGIVTLTGKLAEKQYDRKVKRKSSYKWNPIYRVATDHDVNRWSEAQKREKEVMIRSRQIATNLGLEMKIGDVEVFGDHSKAIFYYIAEGRVDFRQLIKEYASEFRLKVEMKQIGARQEAARIGGIGSCGRELCCSSWRTDFSSINSHMATVQGLSPNAEKLTGRCGKLKCCLMYELDLYLESYNDFPSELLNLELESGIALHFKTDLLQRMLSYSHGQGSDKQVFHLHLDTAKEVIQQNKKGIRPTLLSLLTGDDASQNVVKENMFKVEDNTKLPPATKRKKRPQSKPISKNQGPSGEVEQNQNRMRPQKMDSNNRSQTPLKLEKKTITPQDN